MTDIVADALSNNLGLHLLHWALSQSDIWYLAHRCADLVQKIHEPLERGAAALDNILTLEEDEVTEEEDNCCEAIDRYEQQCTYRQEMNQQELQRINNRRGKFVLYIHCLNKILQ